MNTPTSTPTTCRPPFIADLFSACGLDFEDWLDVLCMVGAIVGAANSAEFE